MHFSIGRPIIFLRKPVEQIYTFFSTSWKKTLQCGYAHSVPRNMSTVRCFSTKRRNLPFLYFFTTPVHRLRVTPFPRRLSQSRKPLFSLAFERSSVSAAVYSSSKQTSARCSKCVNFVVSYRHANSRYRHSRSRVLSIPIIVNTFDERNGFFRKRLESDSFRIQFCKLLKQKTKNNGFCLSVFHTLRFKVNRTERETYLYLSKRKNVNTTKWTYRCSPCAARTVIHTFVCALDM